MYIKINERNYPCRGYLDTGNYVQYRLEGPMPDSVEGVVKLYKGDELFCAHDVSEFARWEIRGTSLILTNRPVPEPVETPAEGPEPTPFEQLRADVDYIAAMTGVTL